MDGARAAAAARGDSMRSRLANSLRCHCPLQGLPGDGAGTARVQAPTFIAPPRGAGRQVALIANGRLARRVTVEGRAIGSGGGVENFPCGASSGMPGWRGSGQDHWRVNSLFARRWLSARHWRSTLAQPNRCAGAAEWRRRRPVPLDKPKRQHCSRPHFRQKAVRRRGR